MIRKRPDRLAFQRHWTSQDAGPWGAHAWRGKLFRATGAGAMFSDLHSNFMINPGEATAADLEGLGDAVRADVKAKTGVELNWEIKRIGRAG